MRLFKYLNSNKEIIYHEYKEIFEYFGNKFVIHRDIKYNNRWTVSEYTTGRKCAHVYNTIKEAKEEAIKILESVGKDKLEQAIKKHTQLNK